MSATVQPLRRHLRLVPPPRKGLALSLQASPGEVVLLADGVELVLTPEAARDLAKDLVELADDAEARRG